jgi:hypothetical protein
MSETSTQSGGPQAAPSTGEKVPIERPKDHFGNERDVDTDRFPEGSPAREGSTTRPSGQGGASPHDGISYQDQFVPNPPPSESAAKKGEENDRVSRGEVTEVELANERLDGIVKGAEKEHAAKEKKATK